MKLKSKLWHRNDHFRYDRTLWAFCAWIPGLRSLSLFRMSIQSNLVQEPIRENHSEAILSDNNCCMPCIQCVLQYSESAVFVVDERHSGSEAEPWFIWVMYSSWPSISVQSLLDWESFPLHTALCLCSDLELLQCGLFSRNNLHDYNTWDMHCFFVLFMAIL